jgi:hypothetical protein
MVGNIISRGIFVLILFILCSILIAFWKGSHPKKSAAIIPSSASAVPSAGMITRELSPLHGINKQEHGLPSKGCKEIPPLQPFGVTY